MKKKIIAIILLALLIFNMTGCENSQSTGKPIKIDKAKEKPGLYIMDSNLFTLVNATDMRSWRCKYYAGLRIVDANSNVPKISNTAQLVLIGVNDADVYKVSDYGYTISDFVDIDINRNFMRTYSDVSSHHQGGLGYFDMWVEFRGEKQFNDAQINGKSPSKYTSRIEKINFPHSWDGSDIPVGILTANFGEEFIIKTGKFEGTEWKETENKYTANYCYFLLNNIDKGSVNIETTMNGYFIINFSETLVGYYFVEFQGSSVLLEFIE